MFICQIKNIKTKFYYPLVVVGLVAVVAVHRHVLEAFDNLKTYLIDFLSKKHMKHVPCVKVKNLMNFFAVLLLVVFVDADGDVGDEYVT